MKNLIANIFAVERKDEREQIKTWHAKGNRMLLWHGTRGENLIGIIQTGFRIAPSDSSRQGAMFGDGVYFSDIFNKCFQYANTNNFGRFAGETKKSPKRYVFLCEVVLGKMQRLMQATQVTGLPNDQFQSVMGCGRIGPNPAGNIYMANGCVIPLGNLVASQQANGGGNRFGDGFSLQYNEYVVYNTTQVRIRYILELRDPDQEF